MTNARALVYGGSFSGANFPKVQLQYTSPLPYSVYDWAADDLPLGPLSTWASLTGGLNLPVMSGSPTVINSGGGRAVSFDGIDDQMRVAYTRGTPHTIAVVFRFVSPKRGETVFYGYGGASAGSVLIDVGADSIVGLGSSTTLRFSPVVVPDNKWHVVLLSVDGPNSVLRVDGREMTGTLPIAARDGINLGYGTTGSGGKSNIEYKRVIQFSGAASSGTRDSIVNTLASRYGINQ